MTEDKINELEVQIQVLQKQLGEIKETLGILIKAFDSHVNGKMTIEDLGICYKALNQVRQYMGLFSGSSINPNNPAQLGMAFLEKIMAEKQSKGEDVDIEKLPKEVLERLRKYGGENKK